MLHNRIFIPTRYFKQHQLVRTLLFAMVTFPKSLLSLSSFLTANYICLGAILFLFLSLNQQNHRINSEHKKCTKWEQMKLITHLSSKVIENGGEVDQGIGVDTLVKLSTP